LLPSKNKLSDFFFVFLQKAFSPSINQKMADYELPSMYSRGPQYSYPELESEDDNAKINIPPSVLPTRESFRDVHVEDNRLAWLLLGTSFFILLWTVIPVVVDFGYITPWFTGDALWRLFDPVITLPFSLFIMTRADVMCTGGQPHYCKCPFLSLCT
jgi:hypothetical protein